MRTICLLVCVFGLAMTAWSQNLMLSQEESEDEIAVVGYFCKNDTMTYRQTHNKYKIQGNDTTVSESYVEEFMIVVTDSTSDGYKMKYIPLSFTLHDADTVTSLMTNAMSQLMQSVVCEFTTDELGLLKSITNWREIRDQLKKGVKATCDTLYATIPDMDSIMPRKSLENILLLHFSTEEGIRNSYEELENLFGLHGSTFDLGDKEVDTEEQGYPQHISARIGYTTIEDEEDDFDGDYAISTLSTTTIPVEDVMDLGFGALSMIVSGPKNTISRKRLTWDSARTSRPAISSGFPATGTSSSAMMNQPKTKTSKYTTIHYEAIIITHSTVADVVCGSTRSDSRQQVAKSRRTGNNQ